MADFMVSDVLRKLKSMLQQPEEEQMKFKASVAIEDLLTLSKALKNIQPKLKDAENRQINESDIRQWVRDVKSLAYDADDIVRALTPSIIHQDNKKTKKVCNTFLLSSSRCFNQIGFNKYTRKINQTIEKLNGRALVEWPVEREELRIEGFCSNKNGFHGLRSQTEIIGRNLDKINIVSMLLRETGQIDDGETVVICIVGMEGMGKTTLANRVYNDTSVMSYFRERIWVYAPTGQISPSPIGKLENLLGFLKGKQFLLVLDDVLDEDADKWLQLRQEARKNGAKGSGILVTTRSDNVARKFVTSNIQYLEPLTESACCSLYREECSLMKFNREELKDRIDWENFSNNIGVPLIAKEMGIHFNSHREVPTMDDAERMSLNALSSTYASLPSDLKACFEYLSLFPKDFSIAKETLIQLWMAQDLICTQQSGQDMEETGAQYFDELLPGTSFYKDPERDDDGNIIRIKLHDPVYKLSQMFCDENRHFVAVGNDIPYTKTKENLRTLFWFGNGEVPKKLFSHFTCVRALDLSGTNITELPKSVGNLKHLRFLNLSCTYIKKLPTSICNLHSLQTLKLSFSLLEELPSETWNLISLKHLEIESTLINYLPDGIGKLTRIRNLSEFVIGGDRGCSIKELADLNLLQGSLIISKLSKLTSENEARQAKLDMKDRLTYLILDCEKHFSFRKMIGKKPFEHLYRPSADSRTSSEREGAEAKVEEVFEVIQPHKNLRRLEIWNYFGLKFPKWIEDRALLPYLVSLELIKCNKVEHLPPLGMLCSLKSLHICGMGEVKRIGREFYGKGEVRGFPKLERFVLEEMSSWEEWDMSVAEGEMPRLRELKLQGCPLLKAFPCLPNTLRSLHVCDCISIAWNPIPMLEHLVLKSKERRFDCFPNLPNLVSLKIMLSPELTSLPHNLGQLQALRSLTLHFCPKLESLPQELKQLKALQQLHITACPLLTKRCKNKIGEDWSKIEHINYIEIDIEEIQPNDEKPKSDFS
ncbi:disease resistance protein RGA2-like [Tasmannia lanceolata]|uniref:disease resistance protein RGA2-like n=1 Tax=Tasmannia lanceolata TaxID=3420 RepID=UPI00406446D6